MRLRERLLLALAKNPECSDVQPEEWTLDNALSTLCREFPGFMSNVVGRRVLDYGCGMGYQAAALALAGSEYVLGVDSNRSVLDLAVRQAPQSMLEDQLVLREKVPSDLVGTFDVVVSQNSMEHFPDPVAALHEMRSALKPDGRLFITFGPPWFSPYGSHMGFVTNLPWVNVLFDERSIMSVRSRFRRDGATRFEEVEGGLNRMTVRRFERLVTRSGMRIDYKNYHCVKGINLLGVLPMVRELFVTNISCVLAVHFPPS